MKVVKFISPMHRPPLLSETSQGPKCGRNENSWWPPYGGRTRDLPSWSAVRQPTAPPHTRRSSKYRRYNITETVTHNLCKQKKCILYAQVLLETCKSIMVKLYKLVFRYSWAIVEYCYWNIDVIFFILRHTVCVMSAAKVCRYESVQFFRCQAAAAY